MKPHKSAKTLVTNSETNTSTSEVEFLNSKQAATLLNVTSRHLEQLRQDGRGPVFIKISGRCVRYRRKDLETWLCACSVTTTEEGRALAARKENR